MEGAGPLLAGLGCEEVWLGWTGGQVLGPQETLQLVTSLQGGVQGCRTLAMDKLQTIKYMPLINELTMYAGAAAGRRGGAGPAQPGALLGRGQLPPGDRGVARHGQGQGADISRSCINI